MAAVTLLTMTSAGAVGAQEVGAPEPEDFVVPQTCSLLEIWGNQGHFGAYVNGKYHIGADEGGGLIANGRDAYQKVSMLIYSLTCCFSCLSCTRV